MNRNVERFVKIPTLRDEDENKVYSIFDKEVKFIQSNKSNQSAGHFIVEDGLGGFGTFFHTEERVYDLLEKKFVPIEVIKITEPSHFQIGEDYLYEVEEEFNTYSLSKLVNINYEDENYGEIVFGRYIPQNFDIDGLGLNIDENTLYEVKIQTPIYIFEDGYETSHRHKICILKK